MQRTVRKNHGGVFSVRMLAAGIFAIMSSLALGTSAQAQCRYEVQAIIQGPFCTPGDPGSITPTAINDRGVVVGWFHPCPLGPRLPFMWSEETGGVAIPLPPGVPDALPMDINNHGEIVGYMGADLGASRGFIWKDGVWTELPLLPGLPEARALALNDHGEIVGEAFNIFVGPQLACMWRDGVATPIELPGSVDSRAQDVNTNTSVVGQTSRSVVGSQRGFLMIDEDWLVVLPLRGGTQSDATSLNNHDACSGTSIHPAAGQRRSWVLDAGIQIDLGLFGENPRLTAKELSNTGQIVGYSSNSTEGNRIPFLWQNGTFHDLRTLIDELPEELFPGSAEAINNVGQIAVRDLSGHFMIVLRPKDRPLGDVNIDCVVDERDLIAVLEGWGPDRLGHIADIVTSSNLQPPGDGKVDGADLAVVLGNWSVSSTESRPTRR